MPYLYKVTNVFSKKVYVGVRLAHILSPLEDLGVHYFTSSRDRTFKEEFREHSERFKREILSEFETRDQAALAEQALLSSIPEEDYSKYYNRNFSPEKTFLTIDRKGEKNPCWKKGLRVRLVEKYGEELGAEKYLKVLKSTSEKNRGRKKPEGFGEKVRIAQTGRQKGETELEHLREGIRKSFLEGRTAHNKGKKGHPPWNKGKRGLQKAWNKGVPHSEDTRQKMKLAAEKRRKDNYFGHKVSEETKHKISEAAKKRYRLKKEKALKEDSNAR